MIVSLCPFRGRFFFLSVLCLFLLFGYTCDLPGYVGLVVHADAAEDPHPSPDQHGDEHVVQCDAVKTVPSRAYSRAELGLDLAMAVLDNEPTLVRLATPSVEHLTKLFSRPPLFLLHASLLI